MTPDINPPLLAAESLTESVMFSTFSTVLLADSETRLIFLADTYTITQIAIITKMNTMSLTILIICSRLYFIYVEYLGCEYLPTILTKNTRTVAGTSVFCSFMSRI